MAKAGKTFSTQTFTTSPAATRGGQGAKRLIIDDSKIFIVRAAGKPGVRGIPRQQRGPIEYAQAAIGTLYGVGVGLPKTINLARLKAINELLRKDPGWCDSVGRSGVDRRTANRALKKLRES